MRLIGHVSHAQDARRFLDFLASEGIAAVADVEPSGFGIWVKDENRVRQAVEELARFRENPAEGRYAQAQQQAEVLRRQQQSRREAGAGKVVEMRDRWRRPTAAQRPLTVALVVLSILCSVFGDFGNQTQEDALSDKIYQQLMFCAPKAYAVTHDPLVNVKQGEVWRLVTPAFLHGDMMHLLFNMLMLFQLGSVFETRYGTVRFGLLTLLVAVLSSLCQALMPVAWGGTPMFVGMSGVVYGLFGYFWIRGLIDPRADVRLSFTTEAIMLIWLGAGFAGVLSVGGMHVANWAHAGGLAAGALGACLQVGLRQLPKK